jgi:release factor glutamine methyltransferase
MGLSGRLRTRLPEGAAEGRDAMRTMPPRPAEVISRLRSAGCVFAEEEAALLVAAAATDEELETLVRQRVAGVPLEQVLGWAEFCGLRIALDPQVFVPRRRTEYLVRRGTKVLQARRAAGAVGIPVVVDLCCGSGAVAAALAAAAGPLELHAADIDPAAAACARRNVLPLGGEVHEGDLYGALPDRLRGRVDLLAVNAPYVPSGMIGTMPPEARLHEPRTSLDGGPDGLELQRLVAAAAPEWLAPGGHLLIETSRQQAPQTVRIFAGSGLSGRVFSSRKRDATVVLGAVAARRSKQGR